MKKALFPQPLSLTLRILQWELPLIMLWAIAILISLLQEYPTDSLGAVHCFMDRIEYVTAALVIACITAVFTDLSVREQRERNG